MLIVFVISSLVLGQELLTGEAYTRTGSGKFDDEPVGFNLKRKIYLALLEDSYKDSLQFAKLMVDMETDSTVARQKARENFT